MATRKAKKKKVIKKAHQKSSIYPGRFRDFRFVPITDAPGDDWDLERDISGSGLSLWSRPARRNVNRRVTKTKPLKLNVDLVPKTLWYKNLRKQIPRSVWDKLRKEVYVQAKHKCQICGAEDRLHCHEIWSYNEKKRTQRLLGFHAVCRMCHHVSHYGMSTILASQGHLNLEDVERHFMQINKVSIKEFVVHLAEAEDVFRYRSKFEWRQDYGKWAVLLSGKPA